MRYSQITMNFRKSSFPGEVPADAGTTMAVVENKTGLHNTSISFPIISIIISVTHSIGRCHSLIFIGRIILIIISL